MSLMFFLSGLFVPSSLARKGSITFLSDRFFRIGLPLVLVVVLLMPVTYYPTYLVTAADPSVSAYWQHWTALPFWPCGPQWFLWQLLALNVLAAGAASLRARRGASASAGWRRRPAPIRSGSSPRSLPLSALAYVPLALIYSPWDWKSYGPFSFQLSRPLHYLVYFFAGCAVGAYGLDRGLLASDGALARHWALVARRFDRGLRAVGAADVADGGRPRRRRSSCRSPRLSALCWPARRAASRCWRFAFVLPRNGREFSTVFRPMPTACISCTISSSSGCNTRCLPVALFAVGKAAIVFGGTLLLSWAAAVALGNVPSANHLAQAKRWVRASFGEPAPVKVVKQDDLTG